MTAEPSLCRWFELENAPIDGVLLDIDGVMLNGKTRLPGSRRFLELLLRRDMPYLFLTNDGNHSTQEKADRMNGAGLDVSPRQIISCGHAIGPLVRSTALSGACFYAMGATGVPCYAEAAGLEVTRDLSRLVKCTGVIIGEENYDWQPVINAVINYYIDHLDAPLIIPNPDEFYPGPQMEIEIGAGGVGRFIQNVLKSYDIEINPIYLGKPYAPIFQLAQKELEQRSNRPLKPQNILLVGDNLAADIIGGLALGYRTALMLTGVTERALLDNSKVIPDMVFESL